MAGGVSFAAAHGGHFCGDVSGALRRGGERLRQGRQVGWRLVPLGGDGETVRGAQHRGLQRGHQRLRKKRALGCGPGPGVGDAANAGGSENTKQRPPKQLCVKTKSHAKWKEMAVGQNQWYHSGVGAPPILVHFSGDWDVHWDGLLTHHQMKGLV